MKNILLNDDEWKLLIQLMEIAINQAKRKNSVKEEHLEEFDRLKSIMRNEPDKFGQIEIDENFRETWISQNSFSRSVLVERSYYRDKEAIIRLYIKLFGENPIPNHLLNWQQK